MHISGKLGVSPNKISEYNSGNSSVILNSYVVFVNGSEYNVNKKCAVV